jgi:hypothetical protein
MMSSFSSHTTTRPLCEILNEMESGEISVDDHQRDDDAWGRGQRVGLVTTIQMKMPMLNITLRKKPVPAGSRGLLSLEDGLQRLTAARLYVGNKFKDENGRFFKDLDEVSKERFLYYGVPTMTYSGATDEQAIEIFNNLNSGTKLKKGQTVASLSRLAPLVAFAKKLLLTPGEGFYERTTAFWPERSSRSKKGADMLTAYAICAGFAHGAAALTTEDVKIDKSIRCSKFDPDVVVSKMEILVSIFEAAQKLCPIEPDGTISVKKKREDKLAREKRAAWNFPKLLGYIAYSLIIDKDIIPADKIPTLTTTIQTWTNFLVESRKNPNIIGARLLGGAALAGNHTDQARWHLGWLRMFRPEAAVTPGPAEDEDSDDTSE